LAGLDRDAVRSGALTAAAVAVPAGVIAQVLDDGDDARWLVTVLGFVVLAGLVMGASVAARRQHEGTPLTHGVVTAVGVFVIVQAVGVLRRTITGDDITWSRLASNLLLSLLAGLVGGMIGSRSAQGGTT
jgi:predicted permease